MQRRHRLDAELVRRGLADSREHAAELIAAGEVLVDETIAMKPSTAVRADTSVRVTATTRRYASRGGDKLASALDVFIPEGLIISGRRCLDAGASTGGFTDVLLQRGAAQVLAVDVGYGQLVWRLRNDARVRVLDRTNVRSLALADIGGEPVDLVVADLSFISLTLVLPALVACAQPRTDYVLLVKPQFESERAHVGRGGIVRDPRARAAAISRVASAAGAFGLGTAGLVRSAVAGARGNQEFFLWLRQGQGAITSTAIDQVVGG